MEVFSLGNVAVGSVLAGTALLATWTCLTYRENVETREQQLNPMRPFHEMPVTSIDDLLTHGDWLPGYPALIQGVPREYTPTTIPQTLPYLSLQRDFMLASGGNVIHCEVPRDIVAYYLSREAIKTQRLIQVGGLFHYQGGLYHEEERQCYDMQPRIDVLFLSTEVAGQLCWYNGSLLKYQLPVGVTTKDMLPVPA